MHDLELVAVLEGRAVEFLSAEDAAVPLDDDEVGIEVVSREKFRHRRARRNRSLLAVGADLEPALRLRVARGGLFGRRFHGSECTTQPIARRSVSRNARTSVGGSSESQRAPIAATPSAPARIADSARPRSTPPIA